MVHLGIARSALAARIAARSAPQGQSWRAAGREAWQRLGGMMKMEVALPLPVACFGLYSVNNLVQDYFGTGKDFFKGSFKTKKNPDDIAEFYQAEDLLKIIAGHPFFFKLFMDKVVVAETDEEQGGEAIIAEGESKMVVKNLGLEAIFHIAEEEEEVDGEARKTSFMRRERFLDYFPFISDWGYKVLLWDQTWTYGFRACEDGTTEVYHHGEEFYGPWPIRMIVFLHQRYVLWACERLINSEAFGTDDDFWSDKKEEMLECMPIIPFKSRERTYSQGLGMRIVLP